MLSKLSSEAKKKVDLFGGAELIRPDPNLRERLIRRTVGSLYAVGSAGIQNLRF